MEQFIQMATQKLGIDRATAETATGGLLGFVKEHVAGQDFDKLLGALPGSADLAQKADSAESSGSGGGLLGSLAGSALSAVGAGELGSGMKLAGQLKGLGLGGDQVGSFVSMFLEFAKGKLSPDLFEKLAGQLPSMD